MGKKYLRNDNIDSGEVWQIKKEELYPLVAMALGLNSKVYKMIDEIYNKNRGRYYNLAKKSEAYSKGIITESSVVVEDYAKKVLGILYGENNHNILLPVLKKGWKKIYLWSKNVEMLSINEGMSLYITKDRYVNDLELIEYVGVIILLSFIQEIPLNIHDPLSEIMYKRAYFLIDKGQVYEGLYKGRLQDKEFRSEVKQIKRQVSKKINIKKIYDSIYCITNKAMNPITTSIREIFEQEGLSIDITRKNLSDRDIFDILSNYLIAYDLEKVDSELMITRIVYTAYLREIIKSYKEAKKYYFSNNKEVKLSKLEETKNRLYEVEKGNKILNNKNERLELQNKQLQDKANLGILDEKRRYNKILKQKNQQIEELMLENNKLNDKIDMLENIIENLKQRKDIDVEENIIKIVEEKDIDGIIIGGHESWQRKMKNLLSDFQFIGGYQENFDTTILKDMDLIIFNTSYVSHAVYYKLREAIKGTAQKIIYVNSRGFSSSLMEISDKLVS